MKLVDTHTHIYYHAGGPSLEDELNCCRENHVEHLLLPNVDKNSIAQVFETCRLYPEHCYPMMGLHPCSVKSDYKEQLDIIQDAVQDHKIYAIGEIGLDLYWEKDTLEMQKDAFIVQATWAKTMGLPVSIHCRDAFDELFKLLDQVQDGRLYGVLHCFTGNITQAQRAIDLGLHLGIGGVVTFKNAGLDQVVSQLPLDRVVLETDAPYLAPVPFRGKENRSGYLLHIAQKVADLHELPIEDLAEITTANANDIFNFIK